MQVGIDPVDLASRHYTDDQMITIMVNENMTQRGNESLGAAPASVAAVIRVIVAGLYVPVGDGDRRPVQ